MAPRLLGFSPSPSELIKTDRSPEHVGGEVLGAEQIDSHAIVGSGDGFDVIDESSPVKDKPGISSNPREEDTAGARVATPHDITNAIAIVPACDHPPLRVHSIKGLASYPTQAHAVHHARVVGDLQYLVELVRLKKKAPAREHAGAVLEFVEHGFSTGPRSGE
jgi:hypothetical protein